MDNDKRRSEIEKASRLAEVLESKMEEGVSNERMKELVGLCADCTRFFYQKTRLEDEKFICTRWNDTRVGPIHINTCDPPEECAGYHRRGEMDMWDMKEMAILIDGKPKKVPGFERDEWKKGD
jgi:hypothetical protein